MSIQFDILTLFPSLFESPFSHSILKRAQQSGHISIGLHDIRKYTTDKHRTTDDIPYGGGAGMVMKVEPIVAAVEAIKSTSPQTKSRRIYFSPQGRKLTQAMLSDYLVYDQLILLCGRYEGVDERVIENYIDEEISIGDYILTGGEFAAMVFVDALTRLIPGVLGNDESLGNESFVGATGRSPLLEYPQYTRPPEFRGQKVPEVLLSGDHKKIETWRREQSILRTQKKRPDLIVNKKSSD